MTQNDYFCSLSRKVAILSAFAQGSHAERIKSERRNPEVFLGQGGPGPGIRPSPRKSTLNLEYGRLTRSLSNLSTILPDSVFRNPVILPEELVTTLGGLSLERPAAQAQERV